MRKHGWKVTEHLHLETAWEATFEHGQGGRVIGVNSEVCIPYDCIMFFIGPCTIQMDALPDIGHACGHNLIGIAGNPHIYQREIQAN
jgi:metal-dependent amidase/aminoacylase/carboxypeptidase family protein